MHYSMALLLAASALPLAACGPEPDREVAETDPEDTLPAPPFSLETLPPDSLAPIVRRDSLPPRAEVLTDSIRIEGMAQPERLTLVRSPAGFAPPFSTYLPSQLKVEFATNDTAPAVRFVAAFAGQVNAEAFLQVRFYPPGSAELVAQAAVDAYLGGRDPRQASVSPSGAWPWSLGAYDFQYGAGPGQSGYMGTIGIGRHGNRFFHVLAHYPADYGDGVGPRFHRIMEEWRWEDDGSRLVARDR